MKKVILFVILALTLASCNDDESRKVVEAETPDGRKFYFMPIYEEGVTDITVKIAWPMHWAHNASENPAVPYVAVETIFNGGTQSLAPQDVQELFNDKNANGYLYTTADHTVGELSFPKEHVDDIVSVTSEMLASPQFDDAWMKRIKQGFSANQKQALETTDYQKWAAARLAILGNTPLYDFLTLSDLADIENVKKSDLERWHKETIVQNGVMVTVTGAISRKDAGKVIDQLLSSLPKGESKDVAVQTANFKPRKILLHLPDAEKTILSLIGAIPPTSQGGEMVDLLAVNFFADANGPLFEAVRTDLRASYGFQAGYANFTRDNRIMFISGEVEKEKLADAAQVITDTYEAYRTAPDFDGLKAFRDKIADRNEQNIKYVDIVARTMLELALDGLDVSTAPQIAETIRGIFAKDISERLLNAYPAGNELIVIAASPDPNALPGACVITEIAQVLQCE